MLMTHYNSCKYVFIFKEFATDYSNTSFEQCSVALVVCRFSDHGFYCFCVVAPGHGITIW